MDGKVEEMLGEDSPETVSGRLTVDNGVGVET